MARRYYGISRGETTPTESASTTSKGLEFSVDLALNFEKADVYVKLRELKNILLKSDWQPATAVQYMRRWGLNKGQTEFNFGTALATAASLTNQTLVYTANIAGVAGNSISVTLVDPPGNNVPLSIAVVGTAITVTLATDGSSAITTTRAQLVAALNADTAVTALLTVAGSGATVITALTQTSLSAGALPVVSNDDVYVDVLVSQAFDKVQALNALEAISNYIIGDIWPPA